MLYAGRSRSKRTILYSAIVIVLVTLTLRYSYVGLSNAAERGIIDSRVNMVRDRKGVSLYEERKRLMLTQCDSMDTRQSLQDIDESVRRHFVVDRRNKLLFCDMEKVGCTFWKRFFQITTGISNQTNLYDIGPIQVHKQSGLESLKELDFDQILEVTSSFTKLVFVRNPYYRIFSGYIDKIFSNDILYFKFRQTVASATILNYGGSHCAPEISFSQFLKYTLSALKAGTMKNGHFIPMHVHCMPCAFKYDTIGKMETMTSDVAYVLTSNNLTSAVDVTPADSARDRDGIRKVFLKIYQSKKEIEKCLPFMDALKVGWRVLHIRGLIDKSFSFPSAFHEIPPMEALIDEAVKSNQMSDPIKMKDYRREALAEALKTVSPEDLAEYRTRFEPDFKLFGYDMEPEDLFPEDSRPSNF